MFIRASNYGRYVLSIKREVGRAGLVGEREEKEKLIDNEITK